MLRVTGDQQVSQFMQINGVQLDQYGMPQLVNMLGNIDVEIKVDEGPDTETVMGDVFDLLMALAQNNVPVPPAVIIEASALPISEKQKLTQMMNQPDPMKQQAQQLELQGAAATIQKTQAETQKLTADAGKSQTGGLLNIAKARTEGMPQGQAQPKSPLDIAEQLANINETNATAAHKRASANTMDHKALLSPLQILAQHAQQTAQRDASNFHQTADRVVDHFHRTQDRAMEDFHRTRDRAVQQQQRANTLQP
jgi:hypothetical protein